MSQKSRMAAIVLAVLAAPVFMFQNCGKTTFSGSIEYQSVSRGLSVATYTTTEDTPISADLVRDGQTLTSLNNLPSTFTVITQVSQGTLAFSDSDAKFTYTPKPNFSGEDSFQYSEKQDGQPAAINRTVYIRVLPANDAPTILTDQLNFDMNTTDNLVVLQVADIDDVTSVAALSADDKLLVRPTPNGKLEKRGNQVYYTPNPLFRGVEQLEMFAVDPQGAAGSKVISFNVGNPFRNITPAMAVRASGCVTCHANVTSQYITDFGFGNTWFAGTDNKPGLPFDSGNIYGDHGGTSWASAKIKGPIYVPKTTALVGPAKLTLEKYISGQEAKKAAPAAVVEKTSVYIGAPTVAQLEQRFGAAAAVNLKFVPNGADSPALSGLAAMSGYYTNSGELNCDGDVFVRGTVYLNKPRIRTKNGCRIYATGPIFLHENPSYVNTGAVNAANNTNLQLVSARAAVLGVGLTHCEDATGWYTVNKVANPLRERLQDIFTTPSHVTRGAPAVKTEANYIEAEAAKLPGYKDASCYAGGRDVHLERILINAPHIHSRLTGNVSGVLIGEVMLFSLNAFSYGFDDVFKRVPVLPLLEPGDYLTVQ